MRQSLRIVQQAMEGLPEGPVKANAPHIVLPDRESMKTSIEALIYHFKIVTEGFHPPVGEVYQAIESPRGELGFYMVSDGSPKPFRCHVRAPSFANLQALPKMIEGRLIADVVAASAPSILCWVKWIGKEFWILDYGRLEQVADLQLRFRVSSFEFRVSDFYFLISGFRLPCFPTRCLKSSTK